MKKNFECMLIVAPDIGEPVQEEIFQKIIKKIENLEGKVASAKVWIKERNLAYFLKSRGGEKKKYTKGCYWLVVFLLETEKLAELKETIRLEENILRSLILSKEGFRAEKVQV